jgi:hypothetical protein
MDFNKLYKKISDLDQGRKLLTESEQPIEECGMMGMSPMGGMDERPTTMSVNMNASGAEGIRELLNILQGQGDDMPGGMDGPDSGPAGVLVGMDGPDDGPDSGPEMGADALQDKGGDDDFVDPDLDEEFANTPNETMAAGFDRMAGTDGAGEGIDKPKASFPARMPGDPPNIHENLYNRLSILYKEVKTR